MQTQNKNFIIGILLALVTVTIWSGNYVVARGIVKQVPPISLAFYRWLTASIFIIPIAFNSFKKDKAAILQSKHYFFWLAFLGVGVFNTFIYLAGHYTTAINLALIGTTAAPVFATILAGFFLKEHISVLRIIGMIICFTGILFLLSQGSIQKLMHLHFGKGDILIIISATAFSIYNTLVKVKPANISSTSFLMATFVLGTILIFPFFVYETMQQPPIHFTKGILATFLYLGLGNSVIGFLCWNASIAKIGASRTVLFANLIPILSSVEAVLFLKENFTAVHIMAAVIIITGIIVANIKFNKTLSKT